MNNRQSSPFLCKEVFSTKPYHWVETFVLHLDDQVYKPEQVWVCSTDAITEYSST